MVKILLGLIFMSLISFNNYAQNNSSPLREISQSVLLQNNNNRFYQEKENSYFVKNYLPKWYNVFTEVPTDFYTFGKDIINKNSIQPIVVLSALTLGLIRYDQKNWENTKILCKRSPLLSGITNFTVNLGDAKWQFSAAGAALVYGYFAKDNRVINTSFESIEAIISSGLFVQLLKRISGRQSPSAYTKPGGYWDFFPDLGEYQHYQPNYYSFPSGHITSAAAVLTVITENYPDIKWLKPAAYIILGALGFSLVANDMHWYSDLPLGLAIGYSFGKIISQRYRTDVNENSPSQNKLYFQPFISKNGINIMCYYSF